MKISSVVILLCFLISKGYTLTCYECDDCEKIDEKFLRECHISEHRPVTTESPESTDPTSPNLSSTTSKTSTSDGSDLPEGSTNEGTESSPESQTTEITPEISTEQTTTEINPSSQSTTEGSITTSEPTQTESLTTTSDLSTQEDSSTIIPNLSSTPAGEEEEEEEKNSTGKGKQWNYARRVYRSIGRSEGSYDYSNACYSLQWKDNDKTKVKRGCAEVPSELAACEIVKNQIHDYVEDSCTACVTDKCNGSGAIQVSIILLLVTLIVSQFAK